MPVCNEFYSGPHHSHYILQEEVLDFFIFTLSLRYPLSLHYPGVKVTPTSNACIDQTTSLALMTRCLSTCINWQSINSRDRRVPLGLAMALSVPGCESGWKTTSWKICQRHLLNARAPTHRALGLTASSMLSVTITKGGSTKESLKESIYA